MTDGLYHVTARGNERRALFRGDVDRREYLELLALCRDRFRFQLLADCLMTNHVHLAIRTGSQPLSRIMARLHSTYISSKTIPSGPAWSASPTTSCAPPLTSKSEIRADPDSRRNSSRVPS